MSAPSEEHDALHVISAETTASPSGGRHSRSLTSKPSDSMLTSFPCNVQCRHIEHGGGQHSSHMCFVPAGYRMATPKLLDLITKTWKLPLPNLLIAVDVGMAHPLQLGTMELASLPQFRQWCHDCKQHYASQKRRSCTTGDAGAIAGAAASATVHAVGAAASATVHAVQTGVRSMPPMPRMHSMATMVRPGSGGGTRRSMKNLNTAVHPEAEIQSTDPPSDEDMNMINKLM